MRIEITSEDLVRGKINSEFFNPFCRALNRNLKGQIARVHKGKLRIVDTGVYTGRPAVVMNIPEEIVRFLEHFNNGHPSLPFSFEMEI